MQTGKSLTRLQTTVPKDQPGHRGVLLVVDDDEAVANSLAFMLSHAGYKTHAAYSFRQAAADAITLRPDLMLADILLPDGNGIDLAVRIRKTLASCKILLFSGDAGSSSVVSQSRAQGYDFQFVEKPIHPQDLISKLRGF
jgi:DNA-binding response OmpR family regulator